MAKLKLIPYEFTYEAEEVIRMAWGSYRKIIYDAELLGEYKGHTLIKLTTMVIDYNYNSLIRTSTEYVCKKSGDELDTKNFMLYGTKSIDELKKRIDKQSVKIVLNTEKCLHNSKILRTFAAE